MLETEIVHIALENLQKNTHILGVWKNYEIGDNKKIDGEITFNIDNQQVKIFTEVKRTIRNYQLNNITDIASAHKPFLLVAEHLFPKIKEELRQRDISYLEANGNIYLKGQGLFFWIDNQKPLEQEKEKINRAFTKTGLKVIFLFLQNEEYVNYPYREIARMAEIGLGNVTNVMNGLKQDGYLLKLNKDEYRLVNKKELLDKWIPAFAEKLQPSLHIGNFRFLKEEEYKNWKNLALIPGKTYWGGEPAGDILTNYLKPEILTLYTEENRNDLIKNYRLVPDPKGKVKVYKKFWANEAVNHITVRPLLVYTDLMNTSDDRCMETAQKIFDEYLQDKL